MNRNLLSAFVNLTPVAATLSALLVVMPAQAAGQGEASYELPAPIATSVDRAEVQRLAVQAVAMDRIARGELGIVVEPGRSMLSRAQVLAEAASARQLGLIAHGEATVLPSAAQLEIIQMAGQRARAAESLQMAAR